MFNRLTEAGNLERLAGALNKEESRTPSPKALVPAAKEKPLRLNLGRLLGLRNRMGDDCKAKRGCVCHAPPCPVGMMSAAPAFIEETGASLPSRLGTPPRSARSARPGTQQSSAPSRKSPLEVAMVLRKQAECKGAWTLLQAQLSGGNDPTSSQVSLTSMDTVPVVRPRTTRAAGRRGIAEGVVRSFLANQAPDKGKVFPESHAAGLDPQGEQKSAAASFKNELASTADTEGGLTLSRKRSQLRSGATKESFGSGASNSVRGESRQTEAGAASAGGTGSSPREDVVLTGGAKPIEADAAPVSPTLTFGHEVTPAHHHEAELLARGRNSLDQAVRSYDNPKPARIKNEALKTLKRDRMKRLEAHNQMALERENRRMRFNELPKDELDVIVQAFDRFDADASGYLDPHEVVQCLRELGLRGTNMAEKREILRICNTSTRPTRLKKKGDQSSFGVGQDELCYVDVIAFALEVVPQVRDRLSQLQGNEIMRQFFHFDKDGTGKLPPSQCVEIARCCGLDQRLMWQELDNLTGGKNDNLDYEQFKEVYDLAHDKAQRKVIERERQIKDTTGITDIAFQEFRQDIVGLYDIFAKYDEDENGVLDRDEVLVAMGEFGLVPRTLDEREAVEQVIGEFDHNGDSKFDFEEFLSLVRAVRHYLQEKKKGEQLACFESYDKDQSGTLGMTEISRLLCDLGCIPHTRKEQEELAQLIHLVDADGSGFIDFEEFQVLSQRIEEKLRSMRYEKEVEHALRNGFAEHNLRDFRLLFDALDVNGDQRLDAAEVRQGLSMMDKRAQRVSDEAFASAFRTLDADESGSLDFLEFVDLMRLIRDREGLFSEDIHKLATQAKFLETRVLRHVLTIFRLPKVYISAMTKEESLQAFCDCFHISPTENLHDRLHIKTIAELFECAGKRDEAQQQRQQLARDRTNNRRAAAEKVAATEKADQTGVME